VAAAAWAVTKNSACLRGRLHRSRLPGL